MPIQLDILVDDKGTPVLVTEKRRMPLQLRETPLSTEVALSAEVVSTLRAFEHTATQELMQSRQAIQESMQQEQQTFRAVQSLHAIDARTVLDFQRLVDITPLIKKGNEDLQRIAASFQALAASPIQDLLARETQAASAFQHLAQAALVVPQGFTDAMLCSKVAAIAATAPAALLTDHARLQKMAASFRTDERLQRMLSAFQAIEGPIQSLINPLKEDHERLQRIAASFRGMEESIQPLIAPPWFAAMRDALLHPPAISIPEWVRERQRYPAAFERRMCADALEAFSHDPEEVKWFVTHALGLPYSYLCAVWEALHDGGWMKADRPLKYVRDVATRMDARDTEQNGSLFNAMFSTPDDSSPEQASRHDEEHRLKQQGLSAGMSSDALVILPTSLTPQESDAHARLALSPAVHPQRPRGRPPGSGTYPTADDFLQDVRPIIQRLRREGFYPSQARVAQLLPFTTSVRQLQRWGETHRLPWRDVLNSA